MRMALDLGLHRALEKLADSNAKKRTEEEERDLVVSSRIWMCLYWFDHQWVLSFPPIYLTGPMIFLHVG